MERDCLKRAATLSIREYIDGCQDERIALIRSRALVLPAHVAGTNRILRLTTSGPSLSSNPRRAPRLPDIAGPCAAERIGAARTSGVSHCWSRTRRVPTHGRGGPPAIALLLVSVRAEATGKRIGVPEFDGAFESGATLVLVLSGLTLDRLPAPEAAE